MNRKLVSPLLFGSLICYDPLVNALSTDKEQPIEIEANYAELDDEKGVTIYIGNVIITQGSIYIDGDKATITYDENGKLDTLTVIGKPAHYRQLPDGSTIPDQAEALRMEYFSLKNLITLTDKASVKQERLRLAGERIEYDTELSRARVLGAAAERKSAGSAQPGGHQGDRVKMILRPKQEKK